MKLSLILLSSFSALVSGVLSTPVFAYVPEYSTITARAADQHGRGVYQIEQEVTYRKENESYTIKETWNVAGENNSRVTLEGRGPLKGLVQGTILFEGSQKTFSDGAQLRNARLGDDWLEPLLHFRSSKYLRSRLVNLRVTPAESLRDRPPLNNEGVPKWEPTSFVRLSRTGGAVDWAIGINPAVGVGPTIWFEQDQFVMRKFRGANQTVLRADNYAKFEDGLWYPRNLTYNFGNFSVTVNTTSVKYLGKLSASDARFQPHALVAARDQLKLPDSDGLREFYSRFR